MSKLEKTASKAGKPELRVLVVDDDERSRDLAVRYLKLSGYEPDSASTEQEAIDMITRAASEERPYVVALVNSGLHGPVDAVEVVRDLTEEYHTPVVAASDKFDHAGTIERLMDAGASDVIDVRYTSPSSIPTAITETLLEAKDLDAE